jgi:hypothetical protein
MPVSPQAPVDPFVNQPLERRPDVVDKRSVQRHALGGIGPAGDVIGVGNDIRVQEEEIEPRQPQPSQTALDRTPQYAVDLLCRFFAEIAFAGHSHTRRELAAKCLAYHFFCFAFGLAPTLIEFSRAHIRAICRCRIRPNTYWRSI